MPAGASITAGGAFTWTPTAAQVGPHTFDVCVSDGDLSDCETITVTVGRGQRRPTLNDFDGEARTTTRRHSRLHRGERPVDSLNATLTFSRPPTAPTGAWGRLDRDGGDYTWTPKADTP